MIRRTIIALLIATASISGAAAAELVVHVEQIASDRGTIRVAVHQSESSYLDGDDSHAFRQQKSAAHSAGVTVRFPDIPAGRYAIKLFHDENSDGKLNRNLFGAPTEPYGISNNARAAFSLPPFAEALIEIKEPSTETYIRVSDE